MTSLRVLLSRALDLVLRRRRDERLSEEIQTHLETLTEEYIARGMAPHEARQAARRAFGAADQIKEVYRDQQGLPFMDALGQDVRFAIRLLRRDPAFAATAVLVLGLGIGVNNMLFTILHAHTMRGLPIDGVDHVVSMSTFDDRAADRGVSYLDFLDWQSGARTLLAIAAYMNAPVVVAEDHRAPDRFDGTYVSANAFGLVRTQPVLGRDFTPEDDRTGAPAVVILGNGAWQTRYAGDRGILGRSVLVNGQPATIVGIMPDRPGFPSTAQIWLPLSQVPGLAAQTRDVRTLRALGRLRNDVRIAEARAEIEGISDRLSRDHPVTNKNIRARVVPINEQHLGSLMHPAWLAFMTAGCLVVLISCANAANLMLARSVQRVHEIAIRTSLGASRRRVVRQLVIEGGVLATLGGLVGLGVAVAGVRLFQSAIPENVLPYWFDYSVDAKVLVALIVVSAATVFVFALVPALHVSRTDVTLVLKDGGRAGTGRGGRRWTTGFLAAEFGLAVVLLAHFVVNLRTAAPPLPSDLALDTREIITAAILLPAERYKTTDQRSDFYNRLTERLRGLPAVSSVSLASALPLSGADQRRLDIAGRPPADDRSQPAVWAVAVAPRYFETLGLTVSRGRGFVDQDGTSGQAHAIVNERFAEQFFEHADPIGHRIALISPRDPASNRTWLTIVGVAPSIRQRPGPAPDPIVYLPIHGSPQTGASLIVRGAANTDALASVLRDEVAALDNGLPLYRIRTLAQVVRDAQWNGRLSARLFVVLTFIAVSLATVGLYAVTAHRVNQRTREIGVRMALGARPWQVVQMVLRTVAAQLAVGFAAGVACTRVWDWMFPTGDADVTATDPQSLLAVAMILTVIAAIAAFVPARRATRLDPVAAIRHD